MNASHMRATVHQRNATRLRILGTAALLLTGLLALPTVASAQDRGGDRFEQRIESLRETLDLSDAQAEDVRALFEAERANRPARGERGAGDREARRAEMAERRAEMERQLADILTPEQMDAYRTWRDENRPRRRGDGA